VVEYQDSKPSAPKAPPRPQSLKGKKALLLANWKPISVPFLEVLAEELAQKAELKSAVVRNPDWQFTHPQRVAKIGPEADELARQCDLMVSGVAD
jgi:hypothetical protein